ncbi:MAG: hypothetical protein KC994_17460 [Candidatus Omnitrophica bacterium]|nr:hypothetical protein [Candidatus Omnitrophota bacterium]
MKTIPFMFLVSLSLSIWLTPSLGVDIAVYDATDIEMDAVGGSGLIVSARYDYVNGAPGAIFSAVAFSPQNPEINTQNDFWSVSYPIVEEDCADLFGECGDHAVEYNCVREERAIVDVVASPRSPSPGVFRYYALVGVTEDGPETDRGYWNHIRVYAFDVSSNSVSRRLIYYEVFSVDRSSTCGTCCGGLCGCAYAALTEGGISVQSSGPSSEMIFFVWTTKMNTKNAGATVYGESAPWFGDVVSSNAPTLSETTAHVPTISACHSGSPYEIANAPYFAASISGFDAVNIVDQFDCDMVYDPGGESGLDSLMIISFKMDNYYQYKQEIWTATIDFSGIPYTVLDAKKQVYNISPYYLYGSPRVALNPFWDEDDIVAYAAWESYSSYFGWSKHIASYEIGRWNKDATFVVPTEGAGNGRIDITFPSDSGELPFTGVFDPVNANNNSRVWVYDPKAGGVNYWVSDNWRSANGSYSDEGLGLAGSTSAPNAHDEVRGPQFGSIVTDRLLNLSNRYILWYAEPKFGQGYHHRVTDL